MSLGTVNILKNHVEKGKVRGNGSFGVVYEGLMKIAVKEIRINLADEYNVELIGRELEALQVFWNCPYIVRYFGHYRQTIENKTYIFICEELCKESIEDKIGITSESGEKKFGMSLQEAQKYTKQLLEGLIFIHQKGYLHRDLKPSNLLISQNNNLKIADLGSVRKQGPRKTLKFGTNHYKAPQSLLMRSGYDQSYDIWAAGLIIYEMFEGTHPFLSQDEDQLKNIYERYQKGEYLIHYNRTPKHIQKIIQKMLSFEKANRITALQASSLLNPTLSEGELGQWMSKGQETKKKLIQSFEQNMKKTMNGQNLFLIPSFPNPQMLKMVQLNSNNISHISNLEALSKLKILSLNKNKISKIEGVQKLMNLNCLYLNSNRITKIEGLLTLTQLTQLWLGDNRIEKIENLSSLTYLTQLLLYNNQIKKIENLQSLTHLVQLSLDENQISKIQDLDTLTSLNQLDLHCNRITEIGGLSSLKNLTQLWLGQNKITEIKDLSQLTELTLLDIRSNQITKLQDLSTLTNLTTLNIKYNRITKIEEVKGLSKLQNFIYDQDKIVMHENELQQALPPHLRSTGNRVNDRN